MMLRVRFFEQKNSKSITISAKICERYHMSEPKDLLFQSLVFEGYLIDSELPGALPQGPNLVLPLSRWGLKASPAALAMTYGHCLLCLQHKILLS